jgi:hypothetical protein
MNPDTVKFWIDEGPQLIGLIALAWVTLFKLRHLNDKTDALTAVADLNAEHLQAHDLHLGAHDKHNVVQDRHLLLHDEALGLVEGS